MRYTSHAIQFTRLKYTTLRLLVHSQSWMNIHTVNLRTLSLPHQETPLSLVVSPWPSHHPPNQSQAAIVYVPHPQICPFWKLCVSGIVRCAVLWDWLPSFSIMLPKHTHVSIYQHFTAFDSQRTFHCTDTALFTYLLISWRTLGLFSFPSYYEHRCRSLYGPVFISPGYTLRSGTAGSYRNRMCNNSRNYGQLSRAAESHTSVTALVTTSFSL